MAPPSALVAGTVLLLITVWQGYRTVRVERLRRALSGVDPQSASALVDGEPAALEGSVEVDDPADAADRAVDADAPVGAYVWRARFPAGGRKYDRETGELNEKQQTFASGIETGTVEVVDGGRSVELDPEWLVETHDGSTLSEVSVDGTKTNRYLRHFLWTSPYVHLTDTVTEGRLDRMAGAIARHDGDADLERHAFDAKAVTDGQTLAVRGEVRLEQGDPVLRGTDDTPLVVSDEGFDALAADLKRRVLKNVAFTLPAPVVAAFFFSV